MSVKNKKATYIIEDGPCRELLFDALKYSYDKNVKMPVRFYIAKQNNDSGSPEYYKAKNTRINGIDHEDGFGHSFIVRGYLEICFGESICNDIIKDDYTHCQFVACYSTQTRRGRITLTPIR